MQVDQPCRFVQLSVYAAHHGLGHSVGGVCFHVREGAGTDEALKWDMFMKLHAMMPPVKSHR